MNLQNQIDYLKGLNLGDMFDDCSVPDGLDMARVRGAIVMRCGLLTPLYSEPETQRAATQQFFFENQWNFKQIVNIIQSDFSPIENVFEDRTETETTNRNHADTTTYGHTTERQISAENVNFYSPSNNTIEGGADSRSGSGSDNRSLTTNRHGNIGVTSAQSLIHESLDLAERFNPYKFIADLYERELILGLY